MTAGRLLSAVLVAAALALAGCGGGGAKVQATTVTKGQELEDLKKALDSGAINQKEYERLREEVIRRK